MIKRGCYIAFMLLSFTGWCQVEQQVAPIELKQRTIVTEPQTLYKGFGRAGTGISYSTFDKIFDEQGKRTSFSTNIWASSWFVSNFIQYGVSDRFQIELRLPYRVESVHQSYVFQQPEIDTTATFSWRNSASGLGDLSLSVAYQLITETPQRPSFTFFITGQLPTGRKNPTNIKNDIEYTQPLGSGEPSVDVRAQLRRVMYPFSYTMYGSVTQFFGGNKLLEPTDTQEKPFRSGNNFSFGGSVNFHLNEWLAVQNFVDYFLSLPDTEDGVKEENSSMLLQYFPGLSFQVKQFRFNQAITIPLFGKTSAADPGYLFIVLYTF